MKKILSVEGMTCGHCKMHVTNALQEVEGVTNVDVSLENKNAVVEAGANVTDEQLKGAVKEAGYEVVGIK